MWPEIRSQQSYLRILDIGSRRACIERASGSGADVAILQSSVPYFALATERLRALGPTAGARQLDGTLATDWVKTGISEEQNNGIALDVSHLTGRLKTITYVYLT